MSGPDGVAAHSPLSNPLLALLGMSNVYQANIPPRSNLEWFGASTLTDGALAATGVATAVAIPIDPGTVVSKVSILAGATAEATGTHSFAAIYSGTAVPALIGQSADATGAAYVAASAMASWTLSTAQLITSALAPNNFIYAVIAITATTMPTAASVAIPAAVGYQWNTNAPLFLSATAGSALGATAAATIASPSAKAVAPITILT